MKSCIHDYIVLEKPVAEYNRDELIDIFGKRDEEDRGQQVRLFRSLVMNEKKFLNQRYYRSLRHFWYNPVKSVLGTLGYLEKLHDKDKPGRRLSQKLSETIGEMVKEGFITYDDLAIRDYSREWGIPDKQYISSEGYQYLCGEDKYRYVILGVEKDTAYAAVSGIARLFGCSAISGRGQDALAAMETLFRELQAKDPLERYGEVHLLTFTDYDPLGYNIHETFVDHIGIVQKNLGIQKKLNERRVGLKLNQIPPEKIEFAKYPVSKEKKNVFEKWMAETGGIDGEPYGLELDMLSIQEIRSLMVTSIEDIIDEDYVLTTQDYRKARVKEAILEIVAQKVDVFTKDIYPKVRNSIERIAKDGLLFDKAREGETHILPSEIFSIDEEKIEELVEEYFV